MSYLKIQQEILKDFLNSKTRLKPFKWRIDKRNPEEVYLTKDGYVCVVIPSGMWAMGAVFEGYEDCKIMGDVMKVKTHIQIQNTHSIVAVKLN